MEYVIILPQDLRRHSHVGIFLIDPGRPSWPHRIDLNSVPVEEGAGQLAVEPVIGQLQHPEDRKIGFDELVHIDWRGQDQGVMHTAGNDPGHVFRDRHPFAVHDDSRLHMIGSCLQFIAGRPAGIKTNTIGINRFQQFLHPLEMVLFPGTFIPGIVGDKIFTAPGMQEVGLFPQCLQSAGKVAVHVPLVALVKPETGPGRPQGENVVTARSANPFRRNFH